MVNKPIVDCIMLAVSLLASLLFCAFLYPHPHFSGKKGGVFLLVFFTMIPFLNMWAHLTAISLVAFSRWQQGLFVYDFRFYSLMLMGVVFILLSGIMLNGIQRLSRGEAGARRQISVAGMVQILFSIPLFPINPIGTMPALATVLVFGVLFFRQRKAIRQSQVPVTA